MNLLDEMRNFLVLKPASIDTPVDGLIVFCRYAQEFAKKAAEIDAVQNLSYIVATGGIGKDSGDLVEVGVPEAHYIGCMMNYFGVPFKKMYLDPTAKHGVANSQNSLKIIAEHNLRDDSIGLVLHPINSRRVFEVHKYINSQRDNPKGKNYVLFFPDVHIDIQDPYTQYDIAQEFLRFVDWESKEKSLMQKPTAEFRPEVIAHAREIVAEYLANKSQ